uniref:Uncharacterized protein n=1 Tax=Solanum tuberosum TaxID=4113 RepID=M1E059_SOLTU
MEARRQTVVDLRSIPHVRRSVVKDLILGVRPTDPRPLERWTFNRSTIRPGQPSLTSEIFGHLRTSGPWSNLGSVGQAVVLKSESRLRCPTTDPTYDLWVAVVDGICSYSNCCFS